MKGCITVKDNNKKKERTFPSVLTLNVQYYLFLMKRRILTTLSPL